MYYWGQNWKPTPKEEWEQKQLELTSNEEWIIDGNHTSVLETRFKRTDLVIFLDINRVTCLIGVIKRLGTSRTDMPSHLANKLNKDFFSFIIRLWNFNNERKSIIFDLHKKYNDKPLLVINSRSEMDIFIKELK